MKLFGVGLSHTGTRSLDEALAILGYRATHWPLDAATYRQMSAGNFRLSVMDQYDAMTDISSTAFYKQLDQAYPGSRFILTLRDKESWLRSMRRINAGWLKASRGGYAGRFLAWYPFESRYTRNPLTAALRTREHLRTMEFYRRAMYGALAFEDESALAEVYDRHHREVREYFRSRPADLLTMDICAGEGWEKLCPFLGKRTPTRDFPHHKKAAAKPGSLEEDNE